MATLNVKNFPDDLYAALRARAGFVTNDGRLPSFPGLPVIQLSSYAGRGAE